MVALAVPVTLPAPARADGDPASDVLLGASVFYPYSPPVTRRLARTLDAATEAADRHQHAPLRVALIASPTDLGVVPSLFGRPQQYADFLEQEISFSGRPRLLVVMPAGYGTSGLDTAARRAVASLRAPAGRSTDALATAATTAVARIAAAYGNPLTGVPGAAGAPSASSGGGSSALPIVLVAAAVVLLGLLGAATLQKRRTG